ncbi:hypothetical protein BC936DRAFT_138590 [Jimgerdemannia flammicorona]|uniref:Uncharacterized protein n=2 Tax=Jimgerdemannia flammicorona TaxID=994334 RepID=A0A433DMU4_9FUNG|nr:hypothetical protein BC936DRAFT_138590 [Jimgerdemannia flammicorona]RUS30380.1 hypothetical protein BC938DRAFT_479473 [Jimgerdemannia flammicorona]
MSRTISLPLLTSLLASSCCVIQLLLNLFSVSCAGFAILTPYRPVFTALTALSLVYNFRIYGMTRHTLSALVLAILLSTIPEIVQMANEGRIHIPWTNGFTADPSATARPQTTTYVLQIEGISCMSCANKIKNTLDALPYVIEAKVFLENRSAVVEMAMGKEGGGNVWQGLVGAVRGLDGKYKTHIVDSW